MRIIILTQPFENEPRSIGSFSRMILDGMTKRGHHVEVWTSPQGFFGKIPFNNKTVRKWLGYGDQFLLYPQELRRAVAVSSDDTLFVISDQALGMWVPEIAHRPHVIHCHDFLALRSALGEIPENRTSWSGKQYQNLIRRGFSAGSNFISVSEKTRSDLHRFLVKEPQLSEVVHNGLNYPFSPLSQAEAQQILGKKVKTNDIKPIIHVGGNAWYKNRGGVIEIYKQYCLETEKPHPLWMIGGSPTQNLRQLASQCNDSKNVTFLTNLTNEEVRAAYSIASVLLFPSLDEGFGWPIVEAMSCGCPVITTGNAPMTEVGGPNAYYIPRMPFPKNSEQFRSWLQASSDTLTKVLNLSQEEKTLLIGEFQKRKEQFSTDKALDRYEEIYQNILQLNAS